MQYTRYACKKEVANYIIVTNVNSHMQHLRIYKSKQFKYKLYKQSIISGPATTTVHCMHFGVGELHVPLLHVAKFIPIIK